MKVIQKKKGDGETIVSKRTSAERRAARKGLKLRDGVILNKTKQLYAEAFVKLWAWAQRPPPDDIASAKKYDKFLSGYIEYAWETGLTRGEAGNALSASLHMYPELRGKGRFIDSCFFAERLE